MPVEEPARPPAAEVVAPPALQPQVLQPPVTAVAAPPSQRSTPWWAWAVAAGLAATGIIFYLLAYAPLRGDLARLEQTNATLRQEHEATLAKMRAEIAESQNRARAPEVTSDATATPAPAPVAVAAPPRARELAQTSAGTKPSAAEKHIGTEPKSAVSGASPAHADSKPPEARAERDAHAVTKTKGVDRAAASAATAALEAEAYGKSPVTAETAQTAPREPVASASEPKETAPPAPAASAKPPAPNAPEKKDGLGDIERESSDDPLEGL